MIQLQTIEMRVHMDCVGCESRVKSALQKMRGVDEVEIDMVQQKVTVTGYADQKKVLKKVRKTGRRAELWQLPFNPDHSSLLGGGSTSTNGGYFYNPHGCNGPINHHAPVPGSSYNYYKHGYDSNDYSSYQHHPVHASIFSHQAGSKFSDENPNAACSIM
ncbi:Heavy metal-associated isoprenylated plant protein 28 [Hirschfeldia incana]|nr:Heavy metal-associated isoprenylated plant protein 28 [Hirschfeldia incana]